jgi:hypothetical protein
MLDKILIDCIKEQIEDPQFLYTIEWNDNILLESYSLQKLGKKGAFYLCSCRKLSENLLQTFYISEDRVKKRIEILRNERLGYVLNRQNEI